MNKISCIKLTKISMIHNFFSSSLSLQQNKLECFYPINFSGKSKEWSTLQCPSMGRLLSLRANIRLGGEGLPVTNTLAYSSLASMTIQRKVYHFDTKGL